VLLGEGEQLTGVLPHLREGVVDTPHLPLVLEAELADELKLMIETLLLEGATRSLNSLTVCRRGASQMRGFQLIEGSRNHTPTPRSTPKA
jgi:hypothetical protein